LEVQKENEQLHIKNKEDFNLNVHKLFSSVFTKTQINYFLNDKKKKIKKWENEDIVSAITLRNISTAAYSYLPQTIPLPSIQLFQN